MGCLDYSVTQNKMNHHKSLTKVLRLCKRNVMSKLMYLPKEKKAKVCHFYVLLPVGGAMTINLWGAGCKVKNM